MRYNIAYLKLSVDKTIIRGRIYYLVSYRPSPPRGIQIYLKYFTWGSFRLLSIYEFLSGNQSLEIAPSNNGREINEVL